MKWSELLTLVEATFAEDIDDSDAFVKSATIKLAAAAYQQEAARTIKCLESKGSTTIQLVRDSVLTSAPRDFLQVRGVRYNETSILTQNTMRPRVANYPTGSPSYFYIENMDVGTYPYLTGTEQFTLKETNTDSVDSYATCDGTTLTIYVFSGANVGDHDFTLATYATVTLLVAAIATAAIGVTATAVDGDLDPTDLENVDRRFIHGEVKSFFEGTAEYLYMWNFRIPPIYAVTVEHDAGTASTACTCQVTRNAVVIVITGGANAGTYTYDFATYPTILDLYRAINLEDVGFTCYMDDTCAYDASSYLLEVLAATDIWGPTIYLYNNPELPPEMHLSVLRDYMLGLAREQDRKYDQANYHFAKSTKAIKDFKKTWMNRRQGNQTDVGSDAYDYTGDDLQAVDEVWMPQ